VVASKAISQLVIGFGGGLIAMLVTVLSDGLVAGLTTERSVANEGIHRSARHAFAIGLGWGLVSGLICGLAVGLAVGLVAGLVVVLGVVLSGGLFFGGLACLRHLVLRGLLAYHGLASIRYVRFLNEATERLFLRRTGSGYLFVHRQLLEYFADLDTKPVDAIRLKHSTTWRRPPTGIEPHSL
jgi:hypothetical protein